MIRKKQFHLLLVSSFMLMLALILVSCAHQEGEKKVSAHGNNFSGQSPLKVISSTDVYSSLAQQLGGSKVSAEPLITSEAIDPHSYEPSVQDRLKVARADMVIINGGGYDDFMFHLLADLEPKPEVFIAVDALESNHGQGWSAGVSPSKNSQADHDHFHEEFNEHIWYSFADMHKVSSGLEQKMSTIKAESSHDFKTHAGGFQRELEKLEARQKKLYVSQDTGVFVTEPLADNLLDNLGYENKTPEKLSEALEAEQEVSAVTMYQAREVLWTHNIKLLVQTSQTETNQTQQLSLWAEEKNIPVVTVSETIPAGKDYVQWMNDNLDSIEKSQKTTRHRKLNDDE